jgi:hypothetical protein
MTISRLILFANFAISTGLTAFGVFGKNCLRLLIGRLVGVLHDDEPVSGIWAGLKAAQPIGDPC